MASELYCVEQKYLTLDSKSATTAKHFCRSTRVDPSLREHICRGGRHATWKAGNEFLGHSDSIALGATVRSTVETYQ